jgi:hypothetical protein
MPSIQLKKITPILLVDAIEPCLGFWEALGFARVAEVPEGDRLGFVILAKDEVAVMYQTRESVAKDLVGVEQRTDAALYLDVPAIAGLEAALPAGSVVVPPRKTFYGADEIWAREPGGHLIGFAAHAAETAEPAEA